jgi:hypothetical protein
MLNLLIGKNTFWYLIPSKTSLYHTGALDYLEKNHFLIKVCPVIDNKFYKMSHNRNRNQQIQKCWDFSNFLMKSRSPNIIAYGRMQELNGFYKLCQSQRAYYKSDHFCNKRMDEFKLPAKKFASRPSPTEVYMQQPVSYVSGPQPIVFPINRGYAGNNRGGVINMTGRCNENPCTLWKR